MGWRCVVRGEESCQWASLWSIPHDLQYRKKGEFCYYVLMYQYNRHDVEDRRTLDEPR